MTLIDKLEFPDMKFDLYFLTTLPKGEEYKLTPGARICASKLAAPLAIGLMQVYPAMPTLASENGLGSSFYLLWHVQQQHAL